MTTTAMTKPNNSQPIWVKWRPTTFDEIVGQNHVIKNIKANMKSESRPHVYVFTGLTGSGKTTTALAVCEALKAHKADIHHLDGGKDGKIDDIRSLVQTMTYRPQFGDARVAIVDECQKLTPAAWEALLLATEHTPEESYWIFCTTVVAKIPEAMESRITTYKFKKIEDDDMIGVLLDICDKENWEVDPEILQLVVEEADGSMRRALNYLSKVRACETVKEAKELMVEKVVLDDSNPFYAFGGLVLEGCKEWNKYATQLRKIQKLSKEKDEAAAGCIRSITFGYISKVAPSWGEEQANTAAVGLQALSEAPFNASIAEMSLIALKVIHA